MNLIEIIFDLISHVHATLNVRMKNDITTTTTIHISERLLKKIESSPVYLLSVFFPLPFFYFAETKRRCGFFLEVFSLPLPDYLDCELFPENDNPDVCLGHYEVLETNARAQKPGK